MSFKHAKKKENFVVWRMTERTHKLYMAYAAILSDVEPYSEAYHEALDGLQGLPNYPLDFGGDMETRTLLPDVVDSPTVTVQ